MSDNGLIVTNAHVVSSTTAASGRQQLKVQAFLICPLHMPYFQASQLKHVLIKCLLIRYHHVVLLWWTGEKHPGHDSLHRHKPEHPC